MAKKVLVINDSPSFRRQLYWSLHEDYLILEAQDRKEALKVIEEQRPDMLLLDLYLPPQISSPEEGMAILREVKDRYPEIRAIIISSSQEPDIINRTKRWGSEDYLVKPFMVDELKRIMRAGLKNPTRRNWQRMKISLPVAYEYAVDFGVKDTTQTEDVSMGGIMIPVNRPINRFTHLNLWVSFPCAVDPLEVRGQVRWTSEIMNQYCYKAGIQFIELREQDRTMLHQYLYT